MSGQTGGKRAFLIGIGGMGMGPLALYLKGAGWEVSGHDDRMSPQVRQWLERAGILCGRYGEIPQPCDLAVYTSAVHADHPLYRDAVQKRIPLMRRGECWAQCVRGRSLAAVVGSHGKTTTTAMLVHLLEQTDLPFSYLIGGLYSDPNRPPARFTPQADWVVSEIDESDGTIEQFSPAVTVALNFDWDHPDRYRDEAALERMFSELFRRTHRAVIIPESCPRLRRLAQAASCPVHTFACADDFNDTNAQAALAAGRLLSGEELDVSDLGGFSGVRRRQDVLVSRPFLKVVADYAHHPTEISALLKSLKKRNRQAQLWVVFQPHRYSRTRQYAADFGKSLGWADRVFLMPVYAASEPELPDGTHRAIVAQWPQGQPAPVEVDAKHVVGVLAEALRRCGEPVVLAFVGAGDIDGSAAAFAQALESDFANNLIGRISPQSAVVRGEPLAKHTTFRIGGAAQWYAQPCDRADLRQMLLAAKATDTPVFVLGRGSNILAADEGFAGLVVSLGAPAFCGIEIGEDGIIRAGGGARLKGLCAQAAAAGVCGFEYFEGIPASVGGALRMNAGAMGGWLCQRVVSLEVMDFAGDVHVYAREQLHPQYRDCPEAGEGIVLSAQFEGSGRDAPEAIRERMEACRRKRAHSQPQAPSAGCVFRNPPGDSAGRLIDEAGLKGAREGGACISPRHANFIVNEGNATCAEVVSLMRRARAALAGKGVELSPEIKLLGKKWEDVL